MQNQAISTSSSSSTTSWLGIKLSKSKDTNSKQILTGQATYLQSQNDILSKSEGSQYLEGTQVSYGNNASFIATNKDAQIILAGIQGVDANNYTSEDNYVVWQKMVNSGSYQENLTMPTFDGPVTPTFQAPGGIVVQLPEGAELREQILNLAKQPGMGYLDELSKRSDVNWQPVKLAFDEWHYEQEGLTPAGAALVAIAVTVATGGTGSAAIPLLTAMSNAAMTALYTQAAITLINNKGDLGKTFKDLGNSDNVKAVVTAALTAGVLNQISQLQGMKTLVENMEKGSLPAKMTHNLINATGRAVTSTAVNGGSLEEALEGAVISGLVDTLHGEAASKIKGIENTYLHKLAHAVAGCVAGAAAGGACQDGAIGAAVGEMVAELELVAKPKEGASEAEISVYKENVLALSKIVSGAVTAYAGGDAQTAINTAETAVKNNFLTPTQEEERARKLAKCQDIGCVLQVRGEYKLLSAHQDIGFVTGLGGGIGYQSFEQLSALVDLATNIPETISVLKQIVADSDFRANVGAVIAADYENRINTLDQAYRDGGWDGSVTYGVESARLAMDIVGFAALTKSAVDITASASNVSGKLVSGAIEKLAHSRTWTYVYHKPNPYANLSFAKMQQGSIGVPEQDVFSSIRNLKVADFTNKQTGDYGEKIATDFLKAQGHTDIFSVQNASGNGIDVVSRAANGQLVFTEVKASKVGSIGALSERQQDMMFFVDNVLDAAANGGRGYKKIDATQKARAKEMHNEFRAIREINPEKIGGNLIGVDLKNTTIYVSPWKVNRPVILEGK